MNLIPRMSRLIVAAIFLAGSPGSAYAAAAIAPTLANNGGTRALPINGAKADAAAHARALAAYSSLPVFFEKNHGQTDSSVKFFARTSGYNLYLTATEAVMVLPPAAKNKAGASLRMKLIGAAAEPLVRGRGILPGRTNYMLGNDRSKWRTGVEQFGKVEFSQVYPGIDVVYYGKQGRVEHDFVVAPGADPARILMSFEGGKGLRLDAKGNLLIGVQNGEVVYNAPTLYQMQGDRRVHVNGRFVLAGKNQIRFEVGDYIKSKPLVIDPALGFSSFLGGTTDDLGYAIAVDPLGNTYVTGSTSSNPFPGVAAHAQSAYGGGLDVFVTKINPAGSAIVWSTYIGGTGDDTGLAIGLDAVVPPNVYVTGSTTLGVGVGKFPQTASFGTLGGTDAFLTSINGAGTAFNYSVVFGGPQTDAGNGLAVDAAGNAYVTGVTASDAANSFPYTFAGGVPYTAGAAQTASCTGGGSGTGCATNQAFVAKFSAAGTQVYATYLGGTGASSGNAIAIDGTGTAYVTGQTAGNFVSVAAFPNVFHNTVLGATDAFIAILNPNGSTFTYKTYVGGSGNDAGTGITVDANAPQPNVYITGWTGSADFPNASFVTKGQTTNAGGPQDAFVFKLQPFVSVLNTTGNNDGVYATYLGGNAIDQANAIAVDASGNAYVAGYTTSPNFPIVAANSVAGENTFIGTPEAFVTEISYIGGNVTFPFSTYLGGTTITYGQGLALDSLNNIYVTGNTNSTAATFPLQTPFQAANGGSYDTFVSKFGTSVIQPPLPVCTINPLFPSSGFTTGGTTVTVTGTNFVGVSASTDVTFGGVNASTYTVLYSTQITALSPSHAAGLVSFAVVTTSGTCMTSYTYVAPGAACTMGVPVPSSGTTLGGTAVMLAGTGFYGVSASTDVVFGGTNAASYVVNASSTQINATSPSHAAGIVALSVVTSSGTCTQNFTYVAPGAGGPVCSITSAPGSGPASGGNSVTITGTNFYGLSASSNVVFGAVNASSYIVNAGSTVVTAIAPAQAGGTVQLSIATSSGTCTESYFYAAFLNSATACGPDIFYPSPATGATATFAYCMNYAGRAVVRVYNSVGDLVSRLDAAKPSGAQTSTLNTGRLAPGVYVYKLDKEYGNGDTDHSPVKKFVVKH